MGKNWDFIFGNSHNFNEIMFRTLNTNNIRDLFSYVYYFRVKKGEMHFYIDILID